MNSRESICPSYGVAVGEKWQFMAAVTRSGPGAPTTRPGLGAPDYASRSVQPRNPHLDLPYYVRNRIQHQLWLIDLNHMARMMRDHLPAVT